MEIIFSGLPKALNSTLIEGALEDEKSHCTDTLFSPLLHFVEVGNGYCDKIFQ